MRPLNPDQVRARRLLTENPGRWYRTGTAAVALGWEINRTRSVLGSLGAASLVQVRPLGNQRLYSAL